MQYLQISSAPLDFANQFITKFSEFFSLLFLEKKKKKYG